MYSSQSPPYGHWQSNNFSCHLYAMKITFSSNCTLKCHIQATTYLVTPSVREVTLLQVKHRSNCHVSSDNGVRDSSKSHSRMHTTFQLPSRVKSLSILSKGLTALPIATSPQLSCFLFPETDRHPFPLIYPRKEPLCSLYKKVCLQCQVGAADSSGLVLIYPFSAFTRLV